MTFSSYSSTFPMQKRPHSRPQHARYVSPPATCICTHSTAHECQCRITQQPAAGPCLNNNESIIPFRSVPFRKRICTPHMTRRKHDPGEMCMQKGESSHARKEDAESHPERPRRCKPNTVFPRHPCRAPNFPPKQSTDPCHMPAAPAFPVPA